MRVRQLKCGSDGKGVVAEIGRRIVVLGTTGSGKTTLGRTVAHHLGVPFVELDALIHGPNWVDAPPDVFRARAAAATAGDGGVVDGNYPVVRDVIWPRAETAIWLDYPMHIALRRVAWRTIRRIVTRERLYNDNRETWRNVFNRDSLILFILRNHRTRRRTLTALFQQSEQAHLTLLRFRSPCETEAWLANISHHEETKGHEEGEK